MKASLEITRTSSRCLEVELEGSTREEILTKANELASNHNFLEQSECGIEYDFSILSVGASDDEEELSFTALTVLMGQTYAVEFDGQLCYPHLDDVNDDGDMQKILFTNSPVVGGEIIEILSVENCHRIWREKSEGQRSDPCIYVNIYGEAEYDCSLGIKLLGVTGY